MKDVLIARYPRGFPLARGDLRHAAALHAIGAVDERDRLKQPFPLRIWDTGEHGAIGRNRFEQFDRGAKAREQRTIFRRGQPGHGFQRTSSPGLQGKARPTLKQDPAYTEAVE